MWWGTPKTHHKNVLTQCIDTKNTKIHQSKIELLKRINVWEREREYSPFLGENVRKILNLYKRKWVKKYSK